jgi:hypothetical protein
MNEDKKVNNKMVHSALKAKTGGNLSISSPVLVILASALQ